MINGELHSLVPFSLGLFYFLFCSCLLMSPYVVSIAKEYHDLLALIWSFSVGSSSTENIVM